MSSSAPLKGIYAMILGAALLSMNDAVSKYLAETYPVGQVLGLRQAASLLVILPYVGLTNAWADLQVKDYFGQGARGGLFVATAGLMVWGLSMLPIATVTAIAFAAPIFVAAFSMRLLGEHVSWQRWTAVLVGFTGVLVIIRPGGVAFEWTLLIPVGAALANGFRDLLTRRLTRTETSIGILFWSTVIVVIASLSTIPFGWQPLTLISSAWFLLNGVLAAGAHFFMIEALRLGDAALISPFRYTAILWATLTGFIVWHHLPDFWTFFGAALLITSGIYIIRHQQKKRDGGSITRISVPRPCDRDARSRVRAPAS